ncbi:hypothetical protein PAERUG_P41_London_28_09_12_00747 [Pseudomonas aeruginosa]|nr:hypothetical protein PAERUG_P41_London_28_09_12_00747 [Pseudomonas aeruginosa]
MADDGQRHAGDVGHAGNGAAVIQGGQQALIARRQVFAFVRALFQDRTPPVHRRRHHLGPTAGFHHKERHPRRLRGIGQPGQRGLLGQLRGAHRVQSRASSPGGLDGPNQVQAAGGHRLDLDDLISKSVLAAQHRQAAVAEVEAGRAARNVQRAGRQRFLEQLDIRPDRQRPNARAPAEQRHVQQLPLAVHRVHVRFELPARRQAHGSALGHG